MNDIRNNGIVGVVQVGDDDKDFIHFSEWWNGEGLDIYLNTNSNKDIKLSLHIDELHALAVAMVISKYINIEDLEEEVERTIEDIKKRKKSMRSYDKRFNYGEEF